MPRLLLIRHGETVWNRESRFQGVLDVPLSEKGKEEAALLAAFLRDKPLSAIYSSPLGRAQETARAISNAAGLEVCTVDALKEIDVGEWSGLTWEEVWAKWPELGRRWHENPPASPPPPGGEYYPDFQKRSLRAVEEIVSRHGDEDWLALVTHGGVIRAVLNQLLGIAWGSKAVFYIKNCSFTRLRWQRQGKIILDNINDVCHLKEEWR